MILHPTRTQLLMLRERARSLTVSIGILKARRQALIREFLKITQPFLRSREEVRKAYGAAIKELTLSFGVEGRDYLGSITAGSERDFWVEITEGSIWGLTYKDVIARDEPVRAPDERAYDYRSSTPHLEECLYQFEKLLESLLEIASFENRLKRLAREILGTTRKVRVLEERVLPTLRGQIKVISFHITEREREGFYRLKKFKELR